MFRKEIKEKREARKMTREELGREVGVSQWTIRSYELNERTPSVKVAKKIGEVLEINWTRFYD